VDQPRYELRWLCLARVFRAGLRGIGTLPITSTDKNQTRVMSLPLTTLARRQPVWVDSDPARACAVNTFIWPAKKHALPVAPKLVYPVGTFSPSARLMVRPGALLARLGKVTVPPPGTPGVRLACQWAWVRYCWAFAGPDRNLGLRLSDAALRLKSHHKQQLSEDLGIALGLEAAERFLRHGQPTGTRVDSVDVDHALDAGSIRCIRAVGPAGATRMRPD
jgi:hypothetical protein